MNPTNILFQLWALFKFILKCFLSNYNKTENMSFILEDLCNSCIVHFFYLKQYKHVPAYINLHSWSTAWTYTQKNKINYPHNMNNIYYYLYDTGLK